MDSADIREGIYDQLVANVPAVGGRVFWEYTAPADTEKPLLVMGFLSDVASVNITQGMFIRVEVLVLGEQGTHMALDPIADLVVSSLHHQDVTTPDGRTIRPEYRRNSKIDFFSEDYRAAAIRLEFWVPTDFWT
jgi:hypothetical protein